jgi:indolepyruvate ferredoxin oxidoreductase
MRTVSLDDKYGLTDDKVFITGTQALVRAAMIQHFRDQASGLKTACFISGYRGSPMHNLDKELWAAERFLPNAEIHFLPAVNEDLAATAIWGTQQVGIFGDAKYDGVFSLWYGKGPGLDRSIDAIRHAHSAGAAKNGGVLAVVGDDHPLSSTDSPAAHETLFADLRMPVLYPAKVQEVVEYALYGWAMSRFSGSWVGFKLIPDTVDTTASIFGDPLRPAIVMPNSFEMPEGGLNLRFPDTWKEYEDRIERYKIPAAIAFGRANNINRITQDSANPRYGIIATGKAWTDVRQAMRELGIDEAMASDLGIRVLKIGMPYPVDQQLFHDFSEGLEEVFVVEEKHRLTELQLKDALYRLPDGSRPRVIGRCDETGKPILPVYPEYSPDDIARVLAHRIAHFHRSDRIDARLAFLDDRANAKADRKPLSVARLPYFCSGCPHNTSTKVPEDSMAMGGVGCHYMATYMDRNNLTHCHMGGEGLNWVGQAPFVKTEHVFQNMGDGTYYHSGLLAIRACVAAKTRITFKILFNDAVAMTGGQPIDGPLSPDAIANQVYAEGVGKIVLVSDEPDKYPTGTKFPPGMKIEHRRALDRVQREIREELGVTVIIYDQTCAAEKRRRRKKGIMIDPPRRVLINDLVCEGCGDCNAKSNCLSVTPLDTAFGRKRQIDQSACNKDFSCAEGFCPSFVSIFGGKPKRLAATAPEQLNILPEPANPRLEPGRPYSILIAGVGGTGVVTIGAMLTMGAHLEGKSFSSVDQFGMAQKGGAVTSHLRFAANDEDIAAVKLNTGAADLVLGCDSLVTGDDLALSVMAKDRTKVLVNTNEQITGHFTRDPDLRFPSKHIVERIGDTVGKENVYFVEATRLATRLLGDSIASNLFILGYAYQSGWVPVGADAIEQAIELNGAAVAMNKNAFVWGRHAAVDLKAVEDFADRAAPNSEMPAGLDEIVLHRSKELTAYQNEDYADRYRSLVARAKKAAADRASGLDGFAEAVARYAYKLMAYKDEYEVARLYTDSRFLKQLEGAFEGDFKLQFHLAPPLLTKRHPETGLRDKRTFGAWMLPAMRQLAKLKFLRGTPFDIFGYTEERRRERRMAIDYEQRIDEITESLNHENHALALRIASLPEGIRGYGHVKDQHVKSVAVETENLINLWRHPDSTLSAAE